MHMYILRCYIKNPCDDGVNKILNTIHKIFILFFIKSFIYYLYDDNNNDDNIMRIQKYVYKFKYVKIIIYFITYTYTYRFIFIFMYTTYIHVKELKHSFIFII